MKTFINLIFLVLLSSLGIQAQTVTQNAAIPKDAPINVAMTDFKNNVLSHEIIIFKSKINEREYQGLTDDDGKFNIRLPAGDSYEIFILGFKDAESYNVLEILPLKGNEFYKNPFKVDIQFQPSKTFVLENCNFETGKAMLAPESYVVLDELVTYLNRKEDQRIEIGGHTDNVGSAANNFKLSTERAHAVRSYLIAKGINETRLEAMGYGMTDPIEENSTTQGRAQNRRTEVKVLD